MDTQTKEQLLLSGLAYLRIGLSVVVVGKDKLPVHKWKQCQKSRMTEDTLAFELEKAEAFGIAIVGGAISGNFLTFDIDVKNDPSGSLYDDFIQTVYKQNASVMSRVVVAKTRSRGFHFYYQTHNEATSSVLAAGTAKDHNICPVLIELRAKGEYAVVPPTPGYQFLQGDLLNLSILNQTEHQSLVSAASSLDQRKKEKAVASFSASKTCLFGSPLDDFDARGNIVGLLLKHNWIVVENPIDPLRIYFRRPGKTKHRISANFHVLHNTFIVHSSSTSFIRKEPYKPSAVFAVLECFGDFRLAAKQLLQLGFGMSYKQQRQRGLI